MKKYLLTVVLFFSFAKISTAQVYRDNELWLWFQGNKAITKKWTVGAQYQIRLDNNLSTFKWSYYYLTANYKINKTFSSQVNLQFGDTWDKNLYSLFLATTAHYKIGNVGLSWRTAYQHEQNSVRYQYERIIKSDPVNEWRNRFTVKYNFTHRLNVYAFGEPYLDFEVRGVRLSKVRNIVGLEYMFAPYNYITAYYMNQPDVIVFSQPTVERVVGITYEVDLPRKLFSKKHKSDEEHYIKDDATSMNNEQGRDNSF